MASNDSFTMRHIMSLNVFIEYANSKSLSHAAIFCAMLILQATVVYGGINEAIKVEPTVLRVLDSIAPKSHLFFKAKVGEETVLLGDNLTMSLYGLDESYRTTWTWTPQSTKIKYAAFAGINITAEGVGTCLVGDRALPSEVYRYTYRSGKTIDSSLLQLPKPSHRKISSIHAVGSLIAFTVRVQTLTNDTLYAYILDTATGWNNTWKVPVANDAMSVTGNAIRISDTSVVVCWQEQINGKEYRSRIMVQGFNSENAALPVTLSDVGDHRFQFNVIEVDEADKSIVILALVTNRDEPRWGIQYWRYGIVTGELISVTEFLPQHSYLTIHDAMISNDGSVTAVGSIRDVDSTTVQLIESTSRGFICEYDTVPRIKRFLSMQDQRPTTLSSLCRDGDKLLVLGQGADQTHFIASVDEDRVTNITSTQEGDHTGLHHIGWFDTLGRSLQRPEGGAVIEVLQCSNGCYHSRVLLHQ